MTKVSRSAGFWATVALVSISANFLLEIAAAKVPSLGLQRFTEFTHKGSNN